MDYVNIIAGLILVGILIYYHLTKNYGYWKKACVPYMKGSLPGLGNVYPALLMQKYLADMYQEFYERMSEHSMVGFYDAMTPALLIRDPELVKSVLQINFWNFDKNGLIADSENDLLLAKNPFSLTGDKWKVARQQLSMAFTTNKLKFMYQSIEEICHKLAKYLDRKIEQGNGEAEIELKELMSRFTADVVASTGFGIDDKSFEDEGGIFTNIGKMIFEPSLSKGIKQFIGMFAPSIGKFFDTAIIPRKIENLFEKTVKEVIEHRKKLDVKRNDFLQLMIALRESKGSSGRPAEDLSDHTVTAHATGFFFDGYETTSITMSFAGYYLAVHPEVQDKLREEISTTLKLHGGMTYEALQEMRYLENVCLETARLYPALGTLYKVCTKKTKLEGPDGITCEVEPGTPVMISVSGLHRDPKYWPDPEKFDPDRFTEENKRTRAKFTYLSFGDGPRICIGMRMALLQMKAVLATIVNKYNIELSPKTKEPIKLSPYHFLASAVGGIWVKLKPL